MILFCNLLFVRSLKLAAVRSFSLLGKNKRSQIVMYTRKFF